MKPASLSAKLLIALATAAVIGLGQAAADSAPPDDTPATTPPAIKLVPAKASVADINTCMRNNLAYRGALRDLEIKATDREGKTKILKMKLFWKPTKDGKVRMNLRLTAPDDLKDSGYLLLEEPTGEAVYFYLPAAQKVQRVTGGDVGKPLWGTDFSYAEIKQVQGLALEGSTTRKPDAKVQDHDAYVLETTPKGETSGYQRVRSYVDQATCTLLKSEFFTKGTVPRKVLEADLSSLLTVDDYSLMLTYTMKDLREKTQTVLNLSDLYLLEGTREKLFDPATFYQYSKDE
ncbi:MAG TPA: outer membrane lipoprotein-sorting protein [Solimonas sp.]|nr:outer membrane lipoprotein-sorting protein [Solimonas sp.]